MKTEQPLWGRGQMVSPQHFQQQAAYAAWSAECIARLGLSHPWGVIDATFEPDALKLGRLQARHLHIRFPDGTLIDTDNADDLPPVLALESGSQDAVVVLALPLLRANGGNCLTPDAVAEQKNETSPRKVSMERIGWNQIGTSGGNRAKGAGHDEIVCEGSESVQE